MDVMLVDDAVIEMEMDVNDKRGGASSISSIGTFDGHFKQMKLDKVKKTATVSLNDCLACRYTVAVHLLHFSWLHLLCTLT
jgi:hypothetical protein